MLENAERQELDIFAERLAGRLARNRQALDKFVLEGTSVLQAGKNQRRELANQGLMKRLWRGLTGDNKRLQAELCQNHEKAIYAVQQSIYRLAEQNSLSLELASVLNRKLNRQILAQDDVNIRLQEAILATISYMKRQDQELAQRVDALDWLADISQQEYMGVRYGKLSELEMIVCVVNDFYRMRQSRTVSLVRLYSALEKLGLDLEQELSYMWLATELVAHPDLWQRLVQGIDSGSNSNYYSCVDLVRQGQALQEADGYVVETVALMSGASDEQTVRRNLLVQYVCEQEGATPQDVISVQELAQELLTGLETVDTTIANNELAMVTEADRSIVKAWEIIGEAGALLAELDKSANGEAHALLQSCVPRMVGQVNELLQAQNNDGFKGRLSDKEQRTVQNAIDKLKRLKATTSR